MSLYAHTVVFKTVLLCEKEIALYDIDGRSCEAVMGCVYLFEDTADEYVEDTDGLYPVNDAL